MVTISVTHLKKYYQVYKRSPGFVSTLKSFVRRPVEKVEAIDDISFTISEGELVGFIGPNGAGKTTTLKCLSGLLYPTAGQISVLGFEPWNREGEYLKKISLVMGQKNQLWWDLPSSETYRLNKEIYEIKDDDFVKNLKELSELLEADNLISLPVRKLSLGQRMKMELIAALLHKPKVLFLDEPTIGLDVVMQKKMRDFIADYNKKNNSTIILTSHYMSDVKKLCKRLIIIDQGKLLYDGSLDHLVQKYANNKIISITFNKIPNKIKLEQIGEIKSYDFPKVVLSVPREKSIKASYFILKNFSVEEFNIEDPEIDDVIRHVFVKNHR